MASRFIANTPEEQKRMLGVIGAASLEELLVRIPAKARLPRALGLPAAMAETDLIRHMKALGIAEGPPLGDRLGSSDVGNVSQVIPTIQPMMKIAPAGTPIHSRAFEAAAVSPIAREGTLNAAKAMAMTTLDLLAEPALVKRAQDEFRRAK